MARRNVRAAVLLRRLALWLLCAPSFAQVRNLTLSVEEGLPAKTIVGDLGAGLSTPNTGFFISESRDSYVFRDLEIDADTGIISTALVLDRESRDKYEFVAATLTGEMIKVKIVVKDVNDHSPRFTSESADLDISELSPPGSRFELEGAKDQDEGRFATQGYRITESEMGELFKVEYRNGSDNPFNLDLILTSKLDREVRDAYTLTIEAFDGGSPAKTGRLQVNIHVLDENDNPPTFSQTEYHVAVSEDAPMMFAVCQVHATDLDLGDNGLITYEINRRSSDPNEIFFINETTGMIYINKPLDFETQSFHELVISARDSGAQPEYSSTFVGVKVLDVNDNSPAINILFLSETGEAVVSEAAGIGEYVARISVSDPDLSVEEGLTVALEGGDGKFTLKQTDDFLYALCVDGELDREERDLYELKVLAADFGSPPLSSKVTFLVVVTDSNDCQPLFEKAAYTISISEDIPQGSSLIQMQARDADEGVNSDVSYSILKSTHHSLVGIDPRTGLVTTAAMLDREREMELWFLVVAVDGGEPALSSTATVTVLVEDINDNEPVFQQHLYSVSIPEHTDIGSCFLQVVATDADSPDFGTLRYSLSDGFDEQERHPLFQINSESGELCVSQDIDRDAGQTTHDILVKAEDPGGLSAQTYVHIEIEDLNDNSPVFNPEQYVTSISSHSQPGTEILNVIATDRDSGQYGQVTYGLLPGDLSTMFALDKKTGVLYLTSTLTHLGTASVKLSVTALDSEGLTSAKPAEITINVVRSAQAPAVFQKSRYTFIVQEDAPPGISVGKVEAVSPANSVENISYRISSGDPQGLFTVHPESGLITSSKPLDHESQPYALLVLQSYSGTSPVYSSTQVNITIADVNDNAPVFPKVNDTFTVSKSTPPGTVLFIAHAHDSDSGANGRVQYYLTPKGSSGDAIFVVDPNLGTLTLNQSLHPYAQQKYSFEIVARDAGEPSLNSSLTVTVNIDHTTAEDTLAFETLVYQVEIGEGYRKDTRVIQVRAHQSRGTHGSSLGLAYSLEPESGFPPPPFRIHPKSGWLYLSHSLDYETEPMYRFRVLATARTMLTNTTATATVIVLVLDANDNAPVFSSEIFYFTVSEGPSPQGLVGTVKAVDKDSKKNAQLSYILLSDGKYFRINAKTGEIINWVALDREQHSQHSLKVMVTDQGHPRLNATTTVHILVTDINDNPPQFTHLPATKELNVQMWAGLPAGSLVASMFAKDLDAGENGTVTFSLITGESDRYGLRHFEIDSQNGDIRTTLHFSQNIRTYYTLNVVAKDSGLTPLEETAVIHVQVLGAEVQFGSSENQIVRRFSVREDTKPATVIGSAGISGSEGFQYSITEGDGNIHFGIDISSGNIYVNQPLDYESATQYFLVVRAEDVGLSSGMNVSVFVSVIVEDVNDHTPWFPDKLVTFGLREDFPVGALAFAFHAKDADGSLANSALSYALSFDSEQGSSGSPSPFPFQINSRTGSLTVAAPLDRESSPSFAFIVTATDQAKRTVDRKQTSVTAQVFLLDVNDNCPVFTSSAAVHVAEDAEVGSLLHHVVTSDTDLGENGLVSYIIVQGSQEGLFILEEKTGLLYLSAPLDYETQTTHLLTIQAVDHGLPCLSSTQTLTVVVGDVNDQPPVFQQAIYSASVVENREPGEPVVRVSATDGDSDENAVVWYSLLPGPGYEFFSIHPHTGVIATTAHLDREQHQHFTLRVQGRDSGTLPLSGTATVLCSVMDDNDNPPEFMQAYFHISLPENLHPGVIHTVQASDPDYGDNGTIHYSIPGENYGGRFIINAHTGAISTTEALDREDRQNYTLTIQARDCGPDPLSASTQLQLVLLDQNDNRPSFTHNDYCASISEGLPAGTVVLHVSALDPDDGLNGEVTYSLTEDSSQGAFSVDASTGVIHTTRPLDRESRAQYTFKAVATDGCTRGPQSSVALVTIEVEDVNDNMPACSQNVINTWITMRTLPNQVVATVTATDGDRGENGTVQFSLSEDDGVFDLNGTSGEILLRRRLRADFSGRKLQVLVEDRGVPALTSTCLVFIHLKGELERLRFTSGDYNASVSENSRAGTWITKVDAHDQTTSGRRVAYSIFSGNERGIFTINRHTGEIAVQKHDSLDFEESRQVELVVLADDGLQTAHCRVSISLQDVNDNAPVFERGYYTTAVWEGHVHNTDIMQVFASDADSGLNGQIDYSIVSGDHNDAFTLDSVHGILTTNVVLDREITSSYKLVLRATDRGSPPLSSTATVRVQVVDVNDNSPSIPPMEPVVVAENLPAGHMVTQVIANDVDLSSAITYSFAENTDNCFAIDCYTGVVTLTCSLDHEWQTEHTLRILASDSLHQTTGEVKVKVLDVNDNAPVFTRVSYQVELSELAPADTQVMSVSATDRDSGLNGKVTYRLLSPPFQGFYIIPDNGSVFINKPLNIITGSNLIQLLVEARDGGDPIRSTVTSIDVEILDTNDHAPLFQQDSYTLTVPEDTSIGTNLLTFSVEDQDWAPENTHLDYAIIRGNEERRFCLEVNMVQIKSQQRHIGKLVLCNPLDRETRENYTLTVRVSDRGVPPLNSSTLVMVTVTDVNDNAPVFSSAEYYAQVSENSLAGTWLVQVSAHDPDLGINSLLRYDIISESSGSHLKLNRQSGLLMVNHSLDYEECSKYTLTIKASDGGDSSEDRKVAFTVVYITVLDENDNTPYFMFPIVNCSVSENLPAFTPACSVHAVDNDLGPYGQLTYSIISSCFMDYGSGNPDKKEAFAIDPLTGDIYTRQTFDYERESEYCFMVEARDKGNKAATLRVQVAIKGVDEFSPVFTQREYHFVLPENAKSGQTVGYVMAMDHDGGVDGLVEYSLIKRSPFFAINKTIGAIFVSGPVYRRRGSHATENIVELAVSAGSPRLDSRTTTCVVSINISSSAEALVSVPLNVHMLSLGVSLIMFLLLLLIFVALVLRYKIKDAAIKKAAAIAVNLNHGTGSFGRSSSQSQNAFCLQDLKWPNSALIKKDISNPYRQSDSSGRGSAEGETAEDQEIKWINEYPCRRRAGSMQSKQISQIPDIPSDNISHHSVDVGPEHIASINTGLAIGMTSTESLHHFKDEGGGEGLLPAVIRVSDLEECLRMRGYIPLSKSHACAGSLSSLVCPEEQLGGSYSWDYLLDWEPSFQPLASVFTDIGMLPDEELQGGHEDLAAEASCLMYPPPLITGVAQPGIRTVPPRMPTLDRRPSYPKYAYSPLARNTGLTPTAMTPNFSPSLSLLTIRTPSASPVISETGVGGIRLDSGPLTASLLESEIQL
ncbi:protocadherin-23 [Lampris incognitus]|uniref:protocadherin-23 n=1 Tax=Lampris incognitus TaxID=2546036 RepID=UPI0024B54B90|nr:protocadherin-23 [Lampris incognitus]